MQAEIAAGKAALEVRISGVNDKSAAGGNALMCEGRSIPWLQDTPEQTVWNKWEVNYRDVVILDDQNRFVAAYNLTDHHLEEAANYDSLKSLLLQTAGN